MKISNQILLENEHLKHGKFLNTLGARRNDTPFSHIRIGPHHKFNK